MGMNKPTGTYSSSSTSSPSPVPSNIPDPSIRAEAFNQLLQNRGISFLHRIAAPCPNMKGLEANSHEPDCPICDNNGIIYYTEKLIKGSFSSSSMEKTFERQGVWDFGTAVCSFPTEYEDGTQADFNAFDQLVIQDFDIRLTELKEYEPRTGDLQALRYPISKIDYIAAVVNDVLTPYVLNTHYNLSGGKIHWLIPPPYDSTTERGQVLTISYFAKPVYVVKQPLRELRVTQQMEAGGVKTAKRLPQQVLVTRDYLANPSEKLASAE